MLRMLKILLILSVALWALVGGALNFLHWGETREAVAAVTTMVTFEGGAESWKATANPALILAGALFIALSKLTAGFLCVIGALKMWAARGGDVAVFAQSKHVALAGCAVAVFMLFSGFIVIAESWFELWRSDVMRGPVLASAYRYAGMIALIAIFVASKED